MSERQSAVERLADQWNATPDWAPTVYDHGRVDQRHEMTMQLLEAIEADRVRACAAADRPEWEYRAQHPVYTAGLKDWAYWVPGLELAQETARTWGEESWIERRRTGAIERLPVKQEGPELSGLLVSHLVAPEVADAYSEREDADQPEADADPVPEGAVDPPRDDEHEQEQGADEQVPVELHTDDSTPDERHIRMQQEGADIDD